MARGYLCQGLGRATRRRLSPTAHSSRPPNRDSTCCRSRQRGVLRHIHSQEERLRSWECNQSEQSLLTRNGSGCILLMAYLNDAALWQAGRATMTAKQGECLEALPDKQASEHEGHESTRTTRKGVLSASTLSRLSRPFAAFVIQTHGQICPRCKHATPRCAEESPPAPTEKRRAMI